MSVNTDIIVLKNSRKFLQLQFAWPKNESDKWFIGKFIITMCLTAPLFLGSLAHIIVEIYESKGAKIDLDISILISIAGISYFNLCFLMNRAGIAEACEMLSDLDSFGKPEGFDTTNAGLDRWSLVHFVTMHIALLLFVLTPLSEYERCQRDNLEKNLGEACGVLPLRSPFAVDRFPAKQAVFFAQALACRCSYVTASTITVFEWECFEHLAVRLRHVGRTFQRALDQGTYEGRRQRLGRAVEYHNFVMRCACLMIESFKASTFIHILQTGMFLGCLGYQIIRSPHIGNFVIIGGYMNSFILLSVVGEKLAQECLLIGDHIYRHTKWHNLEVDIQKDLILVLLRSRKPLYIKAGPYAVMTHRSILTILKTAYSVLSLLEAISIG